MCFSCNGSSVGSRLPCALAVMVAQLEADCRVLRCMVWHPHISRIPTSLIFTFSFTQKIHQTLGGGGGEKSYLNSSTADLFPRLPGSHLTFVNPALEFVKTLCKVKCWCCPHGHPITLCHSPPSLCDISHDYLSNTPDGCVIVELMVA